MIMRNLRVFLRFRVISLFMVFGCGAMRLGSLIVVLGRVVM